MSGRHRAGDGPVSQSSKFSAGTDDDIDKQEDASQEQEDASKEQEAASQEQQDASQKSCTGPVVIPVLMR